MADAVGLRIGMPVQGMPIGVFSGATYDLSTSSKKVAWIFYAQDTNAITHLGFRYSQPVGTPPTYRISLQGVDATTGAPDGTIKGGGSPASGTFTPPSGSTWTNTFQWVALTNSYTPSRGELLAIVIDYSSGTIDGGNFSYFDHYDAGSLASGFSIPYATQYGGASWAKQSFSPIFGVRSSSTRYGFVYKDTYNTALSSTVGYRAAMKFSLPSTIAGSYTVKGFRFVGKMASATGKNPIAGLWSSGSVLQNVTLDSDVAVSPSTTFRPYDIYFDESSLSTLTGGTSYYIGLEVADAASGGLTINGHTLSDSSDMLAQPLTTSVCYSTYDGANWTDNALVRPCVELILGDITPPSSGGGIMLRRNFDGGY